MNHHGRRGGPAHRIRVDAVRVLASKRLGVMLTPAEAARLIAAHSRVDSALDAIAPPPAPFDPPVPPVVDPGEQGHGLSPGGPTRRPPAKGSGRSASPRPRAVVPLPTRRGVSLRSRVIAASLSFGVTAFAARAMLSADGGTAAHIAAAAVGAVAFARVAWSVIGPLQRLEEFGRRRMLAFAWTVLALVASVAVTTTAMTSAPDLVSRFGWPAVTLCWLGSEFLHEQRTTSSAGAGRR